jgi:hypothetical protein
MANEQNNIKNKNADRKANTSIKTLKIAALSIFFLLFVFFGSGGWKLFAPWLIEITTSDTLDKIFSTPMPISKDVVDYAGKTKVARIAMNDIVIYTSKAEYYTGDTVEYIIRNNSNTSKIIYSPFYTIEGFDEGQQKWVEIKTRDICPCGADCSIANFLLLQPKQFISFKWNQKEEWCDGVKTISHNASLGKYRVVSNTSEESNSNELIKHQVFSEVFTIFETTEYRHNEQGQYSSSDGSTLDNFYIELSEVKITSDTQAEFTVENVRNLYIERIEFILNYNEDIDYEPNRSTLLYRSNLVEDVKLPPSSKKKIFIYAHFADLKKNLSKPFRITPVVEAVWVRK